MKGLLQALGEGNWDLSWANWQVCLRMDGAPAQSHCWRQGPGFGRAVVGLSAVSLHHAKALTSEGSGWEPGSPGHFEG